jgi:hypothetical protein
LLGDPGGIGVRGHSGDANATQTDVDEEKHEELDDTTA